MRLPFIILASVLMGGTAAAETPDPVPDPVFAPEMRALFDPPGEVTRGTVAAIDEDDPPGAVRCFRYPAFLVKEVDFGEHGDDHISVVPLAAGAPSPVCSAEPADREMELTGTREAYFVGAKGPFALIVSTEGSDGEPFFLYDLASGKSLYQDNWVAGTIPSRLAIRDGKLDIDYVRAVAGDCSVPRNGAACWSALAAHERLAPEIARLPPPVAECTSGYAAAGADARYLSVIRYGMTLSLNQAGVFKAHGRAPIGCGPWG